jgi:hypothetical protein
MSHFIVEYLYKDKYVMETLMGVEDININHNRFDNLMGVWRCETMEEVTTMQTQIREMRNARRSEQA